MQGRGKIWGHCSVVVVHEQQKRRLLTWELVTSQVCALETGKLRQWDEQVKYRAGAQSVCWVGVRVPFCVHLRIPLITWKQGFFYTCE